ncbi:LOW QUALITY PROTEIN: calcium binding protein, partial [Streptomyces sp. e14]
GDRPCPACLLPVRRRRERLSGGRRLRTDGQPGGRGGARGRRRGEAGAAGVLPPLLDDARHRARRQRRRQDQPGGVRGLCAVARERFEATIDEFARALSAIGDPEGDGFVNRPDFVALMTAIGFRRPNIEALFEAFGPVAGDRIPVATWAEGIRDYYRPEKAGIAGDHLTASGGR